MCERALLLHRNRSPTRNRDYVSDSFVYIGLDVTPLYTHISRCSGDNKNMRRYNGHLVDSGARTTETERGEGSFGCAHTSRWAEAQHFISVFFAFISIVVLLILCF